MEPWFRSEIGRLSLTLASFIGAVLVVGGPFVVALVFQLADLSSRLEGADVKSTAFGLARRMTAWLALIAFAAPLGIAAAALLEASDRLPQTGIVYRNSLERTAQGVCFLIFLATAASIGHRVISDGAAINDWRRRRSSI